MTDPDQRKSRKGRIFEERLHLVRVPCLRSCLRLSLWQRVNDDRLLLVREEPCFDVGEVGQEEESVQAAQNGWYTLKYE